MIEIREAVESDVGAIREIFLASYGEAYAYPQYYDTHQLKKMLYSDDTLLLVAEDQESGRVVGTASVLLQVGAYADLVGEFGRLAVHPDSRGQGIGTLLMEGRLRRVRDRLHLGLVEPRVRHSYSQRIADKFHFAPVGFLPMNLQFQTRESSLVCAKYFEDALHLRRNHPHVIPEVYPLADLSLSNCGIVQDVVVDDEAPTYPQDDDFELDVLTDRGYATLLRFERGRVRTREIFGPMRLHYGLFKLQAKHSTYLIARQRGHVVGAVGCLINDLDKAVRIFELISLADQPIRFLLTRLLDRCRHEWGTMYVEADASAYSPRIQRTLLELGFLPSAYIPAMVFHEVERLDVVKMSQLLVPPDFSDVTSIDNTRSIIDLVTGTFTEAAVLPAVARATRQMPLLLGLTEEQAHRFAAICRLETFGSGRTIVREGQCDERLYLVLDGNIAITTGPAARQVACLGPGDCLGERSLLKRGPHSATATAVGRVKTARLSHFDLTDLIRRRPDIGTILYRNLAAGLCEKLRRTDQMLAEGTC